MIRFRYISFLQILTQEDWNVVLYNGMASTSPWASIYFISLVAVGNFVLFNLLVAILVEGFQTEVRRGNDDDGDAGDGTTHGGSDEGACVVCVFVDSYLIYLRVHVYVTSSNTTPTHQHKHHTVPFLVHNTQ